MIRRLIASGMVVASSLAVAPVLGLTASGIVTPTTTTTAGPVIVLPTTTTTTLPPSFTTTATTSPVIVLPTTTRPSLAPTTSTAPTPPTVRPDIVQPAATRPTATTTTPPPTTTEASAPAPTAHPTATTTTPPPFPDVSVRAIQVTQGIDELESLNPLVAGKSSTWVRVQTTYAGSGHGATVDGALLVEREGHPPDVLLADNGPMDVGPEGGVFEFRLAPHHYAAGEVSLTFTLFRPDGTPVDDSPENNSMTEVAEFHTGRTPKLLLFVDPELDPYLLGTFAGHISEEMLAALPAATIDVQLSPWTVTHAGRDQMGPDLVGQMVWTAEQLGDPDQPVILGRVYNRVDRPGDDLLAVDLVSFAGQSGRYDFPGAYADRFDGVGYCSALDYLGVPCDPTDLGLVPDEPAPACDIEPVDWAGLQLELCVNDDPDAQDQDDRPTESFAYYYDRIVHSVPGSTGGWVVASGDIDNDGLTGSVGWATTSDDLSSTMSERLGTAIEGAIDGTAPAPVALQLVDDEGMPLAAVPASSSYLQYKLDRVSVRSWSTSGDADDPTSDDPDSAAVSGYLAAIPWVDGAFALEVVSLADGTVLDSLLLNTAAPEVADVNVDTVDANETITIHGNRTVTVRWELAASGGEAPAGETFDVLWSNDGFETSIPVAVGVTGSEVMLKNTSYYPAGDDVQVRVVPEGVTRTDNWNPATSEPFSVPTSPPLVAIAGAPDAPVEQGSPIELHAIVVRPAVTSDGVVDAGGFLIWHDQFDGQLFEGQLLSARDLRVGTHTLELIVDSADGSEATAEVVIEVVAESSPTRNRETLDQDAAAAQLFPGDLVATSTGSGQTAPWPGPQSCGSNDCVGDFIAACEEAGGLPMDVGPDAPSPDGVEVECQQISSQPD